MKIIVLSGGFRSTEFSVKGLVKKFSVNLYQLLFISQWDLHAEQVETFFGIFMYCFSTKENGSQRFHVEKGCFQTCVGLSHVEFPPFSKSTESHNVSDCLQRISLGEQYMPGSTCLLPPTTYENRFDNVQCQEERAAPLLNSSYSQGLNIANESFRYHKWGFDSKLFSMESKSLINWGGERIWMGNVLFMLRRACMHDEQTIPIKTNLEASEP